MAEKGRDKAQRPVAFVLAPQQPATGNAATAERLGAILESFGMRTVSRDPQSLLEFAQARRPPTGEGGAGVVVEEAGAVVAVALHGIKSARLIVGCSVPMVVVTGGTDVNVDIVTDPEKAQAMARVLRAPNTVAVVSFSQDMANAMRTLLERVPFPPPATDGHPAPPCHVIAQGVLTKRAASGSSLHAEVTAALSPALRDGETLATDGWRLLLLVAGLRPVKDVLYLADAVDRGWGDGARLRLVVLGGRLDADYARTVEERAARSPGAFRLLSTTLSRHGCVEAMRLCVRRPSVCVAGVYAPCPPRVMCRLVASVIVCGCHRELLSIRLAAKGWLALCWRLWRQVRRSSRATSMAIARSQQQVRAAVNFQAARPTNQHHNQRMDDNMVLVPLWTDTSTHNTQLPPHWQRPRTQRKRMQTAWWRVQLQLQHAPRQQKMVRRVWIAACCCSAVQTSLLTRPRRCCSSMPHQRRCLNPIHILPIGQERHRMRACAVAPLRL
jgi:hypothetical protein